MPLPPISGLGYIQLRIACSYPPQACPTLPTIPALIDSIPAPIPPIFGFCMVAHAAAPILAPFTRSDEEGPNGGFHAWLCPLPLSVSERKKEGPQELTQPYKKCRQFEKFVSDSGGNLALGLSPIKRAVHTSVPNLSSQGTSSVNCDPTLCRSDSRLAGTIDSTNMQPCFQPRHNDRALYESLVRTSDAPVAFRSFPDPIRVPLGDSIARVLTSPTQALNQGSHTSVPNLSSQGTSSVNCDPTLCRSDSRLAGTIDSTNMQPCFQPRHNDRALYESLVRTSDAPVAFRSFPDPIRVPLGDSIARVLTSPTQALNQGRFLFPQMTLLRDPIRELLNSLRLALLGLPRD
ncbi:hypothetical protein ARMSODRAFT_974114 [Armillaria solidipes]|uniref:Uncharacterized protein n=1 Tax=Armillaria solidipes TaxID=1076256 RepID=A0A2H3C3Z9_9AGAR|nr:hypothetical protein ARMSODRAFT_974114 [Armillaria solidipes]